MNLLWNLAGAAPARIDYLPPHAGVRLEGDSQRGSIRMQAVLIGVDQQTVIAESDWSDWRPIGSLFRWDELWGEQPITTLGGCP